MSIVLQLKIKKKKEISDKSKSRDILQNNWTVIFKNVKCQGLP